jgi:hypothetical protein
MTGRVVVIGRTGTFERVFIGGDATVALTGDTTLGVSGFFWNIFKTLTIGFFNCGTPTGVVLGVVVIADPVINFEELFVIEF